MRYISGWGQVKTLCRIAQRCCDAMRCCIRWCNVMSWNVMRCVAIWYMWWRLVMWHDVMRLTESAMLTSAPCSSRTLTASRWYPAVRIRALLPSCAMEHKRREQNRAEYRIVIWCRYKEELQADRQSGWPENEEEISKRWNRSGTAKKKYSEGEVQRSLRKSNHGGTVSLCCSVGTHAVGCIDVCSVFYEQLKRCYPPVLRCLHHSRVTVLRWCTNHTHTHGRPYRQTDRQTAADVSGVTAIEHYAMKANPKNTGNVK